MERYYGFDLGDAESAVTFLNKNAQTEPEVVPVREAGSFITAYARLRTGELLIGEAACYAPDAVERQLRFKSRFLTDPTVARDIKSFAGGVLGELYMSGGLVKGEDTCFYIGCPAGWDKAQRERYREIFEAAGYPPVRIVSESRAALISACQSRHFQVGYDILSRPVLVVDMGSSTTDFAHVSSGREVELQTAGEVRLGGGIMDELLLDLAVEAAPDRDREALRNLFRESPPWRSYCEFAARRLKEKYFADEDYWRERACLQTVNIPVGTTGWLGRTKTKMLRLQLRMDAETAEKLLDSPAQQLGGRSFHEVFADSLRQIRDRLEQQESLPELLFLTGGVSKMPALRAWCRETFPTRSSSRGRSRSFRSPGASPTAAGSMRRSGPSGRRCGNWSNPPSWSGSSRSTSRTSFTGRSTPWSSPSCAMPRFRSLTAGAAAGSGACRTSTGRWSAKSRPGSTRRRRRTCW